LEVLLEPLLEPLLNAAHGVVLARGRCMT